MSIEIQINMQADENGDFGNRERAVLAALAGQAADPKVVSQGVTFTPAEPEPVKEEPKAAPAKPAARKPAAKPAAKPSSSRAAVLEDTPDFEPIDAVAENQKSIEEDEVATPEWDPAAVVEAARKLVTTKGKELKAAATAADLAKISDMKTAEEAEAFVKALADQGVELP